MAKISYNDQSNIINNVIQLKKEFNRFSGTQGFHHVQVYHKDGWYIYRVSKYNYEVFKERIVKAKDYIDKKLVPSDKMKVKYPSNEDFGRWAWNVTTYDRALEIIRDNQ